MLCPCGSRLDYDKCCQPYHIGAALPETAEQVMRSRYSAFVQEKISYLKDTLWPKFQRDFDEKSYRLRAVNSTWLSLEIIDKEEGQASDTKGTVTFIATSLENGAIKKQQEKSLFKKKAGRWYYVEPMS